MRIQDEAHRQPHELPLVEDEERDLQDLPRLPTTLPATHLRTFDLPIRSSEAYGSSLPSVAYHDEGMSEIVMGRIQEEAWEPDFVDEDGELYNICHGCQR